MGSSLLSRTYSTFPTCAHSLALCYVLKSYTTLFLSRFVRHWSLARSVTRDVVSVAVRGVFLSFLFLFRLLLQFSSSAYLFCFLSLYTYSVCLILVVVNINIMMATRVRFYGLFLTWAGRFFSLSFFHLFFSFCDILKPATGRLASWCLKPNQPQKILSGLRETFIKREIYT